MPRCEQTIAAGLIVSVDASIVFIRGEYYVHLLTPDVSFFDTPYFAGAFRSEDAWKTYWDMPDTTWW
jgi:hypothetical protein